MSAELVLERGPKRDWRLTPGAFDGLLRALDADRERAALAYEQLRQRVVGLLRFWGAAEAEDLADQALDRVARKLEEGAVVPASSLGAYVRGVARMIFYEWTRSSRVPVPPAPPAPAAEEDSEAALRRLDRCLATLVDADRKLVLRYYGAGNKAEVRRGLAEELGVSGTALRIRTHRLRQRLEACMAACPEQP
jgi:DNA-directed RNA polymerase specialized sigma24 family protein